MPVQRLLLIFAVRLRLIWRMSKQQFVLWQKVRKNIESALRQAAEWSSVLSCLN